MGKFTDSVGVHRHKLWPSSRLTFLPDCEQIKLLTSRWFDVYSTLDKSTLELFAEYIVSCLPADLRKDDVRLN